MSVKKIVNRIGESFWQIPLLSRKIELAYQASVKKHIDKLPLLSTPDIVLLETLKSEGIVVTSLSALSLPLTLQMLQVAKSLIAEIPHSISGNKNEFVIHATSKQIIEHPEIFYWGLQQRLLDIIENYLCLPVAYHHPSFRRDIANDVKLKTRLWHLDKEDRKTIKICIYLNDVNDDGGPFEYIPQYFTSTVADSLKYNYGYIPDQTMQRAISPLNWKSCTGPSGTVIIADTAKIFHRGKIPKILDRFTIFYGYTSRSPKHPFYCKRPLLSENSLIITAKLSETQKQCVFW